MKSLWIPLVAVIVLVAASTASADWVYTGVTGWTYVAPVYPAPTVYYHAPAPPMYVYRSPVVVAPRVIAPAPVMIRSAPVMIRSAPVMIRSAPFVVRPRVMVPRRVYRRAVWTVW